MIYQFHQQYCTYEYTNTAENSGIRQTKVKSLFLKQKTFLEKVENSERMYENAAEITDLRITWFEIVFLFHLNGLSDKLNGFFGIKRTLRDKTKLSNGKVKSTSREVKWMSGCKNAIFLVLLQRLLASFQGDG